MSPMMNCLHFHPRRLDEAVLPEDLLLHQNLGVAPLPSSCDTYSGMDPVEENSGTVAHREAPDWAAKLRQ